MAELSTQKLLSLVVKMNAKGSSMFIEEFLRFVNLGGQVWATAAIGMVEQHELTVVLADLVLGKSSLTENRYLLVPVDHWMFRVRTQVAGSGRLRDGTCADRILYALSAK